MRNRWSRSAAARGKNTLSCGASGYVEGEGKSNGHDGPTVASDEQAPRQAELAQEERHRCEERNGQPVCEEEPVLRDEIRPSASLPRREIVTATARGEEELRVRGAHLRGQHRQKEPEGGKRRETS